MQIEDVATLGSGDIAEVAAIGVPLLRIDGDGSALAMLRRS
jgi:hypothetical protein